MKRGAIYLYYIILLSFLTVFGFNHILPMPLRILYLIALFFPIISKYQYLMPSSMVCFYSIGLVSVTQGVMPTTAALYLFILIFGLLFIPPKRRKFKNIDFYLFTYIAIYILLINVFNGGKIPNLFYTIVLFLVLGRYYNEFDKTSSNLLLNAFCVVSIISSITYILNYHNYLYEYDSGLFRSGWQDPNYFSSMIGAGELIAMLQLLYSRKSSGYMKTFWVMTMSVSFIVQLLLGSRGGLLATILSMGALLMLSKIKPIYKFSFIVLSLVFIFLLFKMNLFDLIINRLSDGDKTGSGRLDIWTLKVNDFISTSSPLQLLFGVGYDQGFSLGGDFGKSYGGLDFHNDFFAILCNYGFCGLALFMYVIINPIRKCVKRNRGAVIILLLYILLVSCTLEPINKGNFTILGMYFIILLLSSNRLVVN